MAEAVSFKIYYSSRSKPGGGMWCPDCVAVEEPLAKAFNSPGAPDAEIIYIERLLWKDPSNEYRTGSEAIKALPTLVKLDASGKVLARLEESEILEPGRLTDFLK